MSSSTKISDCHLIELPKIGDRNGFITFVNNGIETQFNIKRVYYLYDVPTGESRAAHAHKNLYQIIIGASGSFTISINDSINKKDFLLNNPAKGLLLVPGIWRDITNFSSGAICLVLASEKYDESDYIRNYDEFEKYKKD